MKSRTLIKGGLAGLSSIYLLRAFGGSLLPASKQANIRLAVAQMYDMGY